MILITTQLHSWQGEVCDHMPAWLQRQKSDHTETLWLCASKLLLADPSRPHQSHQSGTWRDHTLWGHTSCASKPHWLTTIARHTDCLTTLLFQPHYFANNGQPALPRCGARPPHCEKVWTKTEKLLASVTLLVSLLRHLPCHVATGW